METRESYRHQRPGLITAVDLAGPGITRAFEELGRQDDLAEPPSDPAVAEAVERRRQRAARTGEAIDAIALMQLDLLTAPVADLPVVAGQHFDTLLEVGVEGDPGARVFQAASSHLILRSRALLWRTKMAAILVQIAQDPRMQIGQIDHLLQGLSKDGSLAFRSASGLHDGLYTFDAYLGPMLGALSPSVWPWAHPGHSVPS